MRSSWMQDNDRWSTSLLPAPQFTFPSNQQAGVVAPHPCFSQNYPIQHEEILICVRLYHKVVGILD